MCSTLLVATVEYYVSNNSTVYVLLIDAYKTFDRLCHSKLFEILETYNICPLVINAIFLTQWSKTVGSAFSNFIFHLY